jgi:hypothetical protein
MDLGEKINRSPSAARDRKDRSIGNPGDRFSE